MKKFSLLSAALLLTASVALAGETVTQSENQMKEKTVRSTTVQDDIDQPAMEQHQSTTLEKKRETTTSNAPGDDPTLRTRTGVEQRRSETSTSETTESRSPGPVQEYSHQSETHHQHTTTEVEKR